MAGAKIIIMFQLKTIFQFVKHSLKIALAIELMVILLKINWNWILREVVFPTKTVKKTPQKK